MTDMFSGTYIVFAHWERSGDELCDSSITRIPIDSHHRGKFCCAFWKENNLKNSLLAFCDHRLPQMWFGVTLFNYMCIIFYVGMCACIILYWVPVLHYDINNGWKQKPSYEDSRFILLFPCIYKLSIDGRPAWRVILVCCLVYRMNMHQTTQLLISHLSSFHKLSC